MKHSQGAFAPSLWIDVTCILFLCWSMSVSICSFVVQNWSAVRIYETSGSASYFLQYRHFGRQGFCIDGSANSVSVFNPSATNCYEYDPTADSNLLDSVNSLTAGLAVIVIIAAVTIVLLVTSHWVASRPLHLASAVLSLCASIGHASFVGSWASHFPEYVSSNTQSLIYRGLPSSVPSGSATWSISSVNGLLISACVMEFLVSVMVGLLYLRAEKQPKEVKEVILMEFVVEGTPASEQQNKLKTQKKVSSVTVIEESNKDVPVKAAATIVPSVSSSFVEEKKVASRDADTAVANLSKTPERSSLKKTVSNNHVNDSHGSSVDKARSNTPIDNAPSNRHIVAKAEEAHLPTDTTTSSSKQQPSSSKPRKQSVERRGSRSDDDLVRGDGGKTTERVKNEVKPIKEEDDEDDNASVATEKPPVPLIISTREAAVVDAKKLDHRTRSSSGSKAVADLSAALMAKPEEARLPTDAAKQQQQPSNDTKPKSKRPVEKKNSSKSEDEVKGTTDSKAKEQVIRSGEGKVIKGGDVPSPKLISDVVDAKKSKTVIESTAATMARQEETKQQSADQARQLAEERRRAELAKPKRVAELKVADWKKRSQQAVQASEQETKAQQAQAQKDTAKKVVTDPKVSEQIKNAVMFIDDNESVVTEKPPVPLVISTKESIPAVVAVDAAAATRAEKALKEQNKEKEKKKALKEKEQNEAKLNMERIKNAVKHMAEDTESVVTEKPPVPLIINASKGNVNFAPSEVDTVITALDLRVGKQQSKSNRLGTFFTRTPTKPAKSSKENALKRAASAPPQRMKEDANEGRRTSQSPDLSRKHSQSQQKASAQSPEPRRNTSLEQPRSYSPERLRTSHNNTKSPQLSSLGQPAVTGPTFERFWDSTPEILEPMDGKEKEKRKGACEERKQDKSRRHDKRRDHESSESEDEGKRQRRESRRKEKQGQSKENRRSEKERPLEKSESTERRDTKRREEREDRRQREREERRQARREEKRKEEREDKRKEERDEKRRKEEERDARRKKEQERRRKERRELRQREEDSLSSSSESEVSSTSSSSGEEERARRRRVSRSRDQSNTVSRKDSVRKSHHRSALSEDELYRREKAAEKEKRRR